MIMLTRDTRILLGVQPADFRKGIDGFQGLCRGALGQDPRDGTLYVFINRSRTMIRGLVYHQGGFWLMTKRLSSGRFTGWPAAGEPVSASSAERLRALLAGRGWQALDPVGTCDATSTPPDPLASHADQSLASVCSPATSCVTV